MAFAFGFVKCIIAKQQVYEQLTCQVSLGGFSEAYK